MFPSTLLIAAFMTANLAAPAAPAAKIDPAAHRAEIEAWRAARIERLERPDSWLTLVGLHWIEPGRHTVGSARGNGIVLNTGPARLGVLELAHGVVTFTADPVAGVTYQGRVDGAELRGAAGEPGETATAVAAASATATSDGPMKLSPDSAGAPTFVHFGRANFHVIERSGKLALRVKDNDAEARKAFAGLDTYAIDPAFRFDARYEPHQAGKTLPIANVIGTLDDMPNPGAVVFWRDGEEYRLEAVDEGDGQLFLIFADRTSGKATYGAGRFLYADPPRPGSDHVVVDFNKAYNPPCVFTPYATCPLAPPENRLDLAVTAGEKNYAKAAH